MSKGYDLLEAQKEANVTMQDIQEKPGERGVDYVEEVDPLPFDDVPF